MELNENGFVLDRMEPSASTIYVALTMLFADELFRWNLSFQIRNVENVEPSDWEIAQRYIVWTVMTIMALVLFIMGLQ